MPLDARLIGQQQSGPLNWMLRRERQPKSLADYGVQDIPFAPGLSSMVSELFKMAKAGAEHPGDVLAGKAEPSPERAMDLAMTAPLATGFVGPAMLASGAKQAAAPAFFSALSKAVDQSPLTKAPGEQWLGTLRNTPGVKPDELEWTGFSDWAKTQPNLTKQQAQEYLRANQVDVQEVVKGEKIPLDGPVGFKWGEGGIPKFGGPNTTLPGGENYRELLLTLPSKQRFGSELTRDEIAREQMGVSWNNLSREQRDVLSENVGRDLSKDAEPISPDFRSGHYDEPNVLAHVRFNDRIDSQGKKTLFIEEIQSDWHQKGRKQGYQTEKGDAEAIHAELEKARADFFNNVPGAGERVDDLTGRLERLENYGANRVPDAPFKKDWHELSLKRMIKWAADNGYDSVSWTPGKVQAERYDLSKQIKLLSASKDGDKYLIYIEGLDGSPAFRNRNGFSEHGQKSVTPKEMEELVGKEAAENMIKGADSLPQGSWYDSSDADLQVGGEGMKAFYDKMMVNSANKLGKKFGAKVGVTRIGSKDQVFPYETVYDKPAQQEVWSLPITDAMRTKAQTEGFPLFANNPMAAAPGLTAASMGSQQKLTPEQAKAYLRGNLL